MPLSTGPVAGSNVPSVLKSPLGRQFAGLLRERSFDNAQIVDGIRIYNVFRCIPFFDSTTYIEWCSLNAIPVIHRGEIQIPWESRRWQNIEDIGVGNALIAPLIHVMSALGAGGSHLVEL